MSQSFTLKSIKYSTRQLGEGSLSIDENSKGAEVLERRRRWLRDSWELVKSFNFDAQTEVRLDGTRVFVDDLELETADENASKTIAYLISKPRHEVQRRAKQQALEQVAKSAKEFLTRRAETLIWAQNLRTAPRQVLLQASSALPQDTQDPVAELLQMRSTELKKSLEIVDTTVAGISDDIRGAWINTYYAVLYGIGVVQNAIFRNDGSSLEVGFKLLSQICSTDFSNLKGLPLEEVTNRLSAQAFTQIAQIELSTP